jgi:hypothetical protein
MHTRTYLRFEADYPTPKAGQSGAGPVASTLIAGLRAKGFTPSEPEDQEYAHSFRCPSGRFNYEIMVAFDFVDGGRTWEVSCPPSLGFFSRLFGQNEDKELSALIKAIHETMTSEGHAQRLQWYPRYGDKSNGSPVPT